MVVLSAVPCCLIRTGYVSLEDYMTFVIGHETENVESDKEVEGAFQAITSGGDKPYVTKEELYQVCVWVNGCAGEHWVWVNNGCVGEHWVFTSIMWSVCVFKYLVVRVGGVGCKYL